MSRKELELWLEDCQGRLSAAEEAGDEQAVDDIKEEIYYVLSELAMVVCR